MSIDARVRAVFAEVLSPEVAGQLTVASTTDTVEGWDSHTFVAIILGLEKRFGITLTALEAARLQSIAAIQELIVARGIRLAP